MEGGVTIQVAADLYGKKENILIEYPSGCTLAEVLQLIERTYDEEAKSRRPLSVPYKQFTIQYMQLYSEEGWLDVLSVRQLTEGCQVFAFQPKSSEHSDSQELIPVAKLPVMKVQGRSKSVSPTRLRQPEMVESVYRPPPGIEDITAVYTSFNAATPGHVTISEIRLSLQRLGVDLSLATVASLFGYPPSHTPDTDTRSVTLDDWLRFSSEHPNIISALCRQGTAPELMREVVDGQKKRLEILQRTHKETVARAQQHASERLYRGKSSSGMGGKKTIAAEHNRAEQGRSSSKAAQKRSTSSSSTARWKPTGKKIDSSGVRSASSAATPLKKKPTATQSRQRSSSMSANYSAVPKGGTATGASRPRPARQVSPIRGSGVSPSAGGVSYQPSQSPLLSAEQQIEAYESYRNQLVQQQQQLLSQHLYQPPPQMRTSASPPPPAESYADIEARLSQSMPGGSRATSLQPQSPPRPSSSLIPQSSLTAHTPTLGAAAAAGGGYTNPVGGYSQPQQQPPPPPPPPPQQQQQQQQQPHPTGGYIRSEPLQQQQQQLATPAELPPPSLPSAMPPKVAHVVESAILSPGGSSIPLPVAAPPMAPLNEMSGTSRMTPIPPPTPAYGSELRSPSASVSSAYPARSGTASSSLPPSKRWYPNLVSPAPGAS